MNTPRSRERKARKVTPTIDPKDLFSAMAYDLGLSTHPEYLKGLALLANQKYLGFLQVLDEMTAQTYQSVGDVRYRLHQLAALLQKYPFDDERIDREAVALEKFRRSEHACRRMNQKLRARRYRVEPAHMQYMRDFISSVIGLEPDYDRIFDACDFGPGASVGVHGADTSVLNKLDVLTCTPAAAPVALSALQRNYHYASYILQHGGGQSELCQVPLRAVPPYRIPDDRVEHVQYNKITCVPKNAKTHRTIAIEPSLNGFLQKGVDVFLRRRLLRIGVDLSNQALNQALARLGSIGRGYATIDLSAASDSISIQLVKELLPPGWFSFLDLIRSPSYRLPDGKCARYEKFCSMGNGFCFPLETLIFYAASSYAMSVTADARFHTFAVYGDDIIVPQGSALLLLEVLRDLGFRHNVDKTFIHGGFRESCGADFFFGENVRPVYVKEPLKTMGIPTYAFLNELRRRKMLRTWQCVFDAIPGSNRYLRPYHREDNSAITVPLDVFLSSRHAKWCRDTCRWTWKGITVQPASGRNVQNDIELALGKFRGDLLHSDTFSARFSERVRVMRFS